ncbi:winged helix DNA-binding protein [Halorubrum vacuolatum]|uniref:RNA12 protein n=1 Tax=Halorubrum vacuolatum TaxID=63740 RepID=A0A238YFA6_HALVU|nr:winged helix DNA-binding protein [Halorubrum vacuolatum]SNR69274.1 RNA12 protein [Halorubrum vacuolatum]
MTDDLQLRDKDQAVLHAIQQGHNDTQKITQHTTLENHHTRYSLKKLENQGLITLKKPDGMTERIINGQKRVFQTPWKAQLTQKGLQTLKQTDPEKIEALKNMNHKELVEKVHQLEAEIKTLQASLEAFRKQVQEHL